MTIEELEKKLSKYPKNTELYSYDSVWGALGELNCVVESMTCHGSKFKGKEKRILILKSKE
jgi:hypothetical protein